MRSLPLYRAILLAIALLLPAAAFAHHGWSWTTGGNIRLTGTVVEARLGNPHGELVVEVDGERWTVEVGQPWRNRRSGLEDGDLAPGTEITVEGEPDADPETRVLKVERLWLDGRKHELYPERD
ncbi:MAG: DUF6152 family protein [Halofilum sp. (in: g-proteobacteria)]|nr:DUF6152 family protein [Halofilum sp. (in: g-proteobacteria)]